MKVFEFRNQNVHTRMSPIESHAAYLRHLSRPSALLPFLRERHGILAKDARAMAAEVSPFIEQGLAFYDASRTASMRVRPVLQYYGYLNFAAAVVLVYRPDGWQGYRVHGAEDVTRSLRNINASSPVVRIKRGTLTLFHSIIAECPLPKNKLSLKHLMVPIPMVAAELNHVCGLQASMVIFRDHLFESDSESGKHVHSRFEFLQLSPGLGARERSTPPDKLLRNIAPALFNDFDASVTNDGFRAFISKQRWTIGNRARAEAFHSACKFRICNFGGQSRAADGTVAHVWRIAPPIPVLPTLTASLLLSFALSSLCRYRANILDRVENSKVNLLCEVFANESDGFIIPAMRNLLYRELLTVSPMAIT